MPSAYLDSPRIFDSLMALLLMLNINLRSHVCYLDFPVVVLCFQRCDSQVQDWKAYHLACTSARRTICQESVWKRICNCLPSNALQFWHLKYVVQYVARVWKIAWLQRTCFSIFQACWVRVLKNLLCVPVSGALNSKRSCQLSLGQVVGSKCPTGLHTYIGLYGSIS